jgi:predicted RNase H-like nuclease (RuvC/YqgF family)
MLKKERERELPLKLKERSMKTAIDVLEDRMKEVEKQYQEVNSRLARWGRAEGQHLEWNAEITARFERIEKLLTALTNERKSVK